ncbi:lipoprotein signal peptidase [Nitrospira sp. KM1]|uniref:signal peptidase II n=1 Tax=Nitrospira sp. KM1 TaxID=1936990 RepID=UPI0013A7639B|nr:signal peptidase II [Nitrospira sp. KM1]BCA53824.1 lipoprotein signal peptidase [Nitrospira sp. KM1]
MRSWKRNLLILIVLLSCIGCDQVTKDLAHHHLAAESRVSWFQDTFRLEYVENSGAFLSLGTGLPEELRIVLFQVAVGIGMLTLLIFLMRSSNHPAGFIVAWTLIMAGGVSNLLDRVLHHGKVIDFMNVGIGPFRTGIFNFADIFITIGLCIFLLLSLRTVDRPAV